ncbi:MAG: TRAP transporter substrate-binding protein [Bacillota bacterium]|jgi:tripartite ATP-independent transporter DctP family solute receptor
MSKAKKWFLLMLIAVVSLVFVACGSNDASNGDGNAETKTIKIAHYAGPTHQVSISLNEVFKPMVEEKSNGALKVEVYGDGKLGSENEYLSAVRSGSIQMGVNGAIMGSEVPEVEVIGLPFLFNDLNEAKKVLTSPVAMETVPGFEEKLGLHPLGFSPGGFRIFTSNTPLDKVEDYKGLKLRMTEGYEVRTKTGQALKTNVTPLPLTEVFTALESGVIDAQENPSATIISSKLHEVQDYVVLTNHIFSHDIIYINDNFWNSLTDEQKAIIEEAIDATEENCWKIVMENEQKDIDFFKEHGLTVIEPDEEYKNDLKAAVQPVYDWYYEKNAWAKELVDKIDAAK